MSTETNKGYMLIFHSTDWHQGLSPEEMQGVMNRWGNWFTELKDAGKVVGGNPLEPVGKVVSGEGGSVVSDGPFAESKEAIGGYFMLNVATLDEAVEIAKDCPGLAYDVKVEVRPVADECASAEEVAEQSAAAAAVA